MANIIVDKTREEGGVFGIYGHQQAALLTYLGLCALQHRGPESCGIAVANDLELHLERATGHVSEAFDESRLNRLAGASAIGHVRYSTGAEISSYAQPMLVTCAHGKIAACHNGNFPFAQETRLKLEREGAIFSSTCDLEIVLHQVARSRLASFREIIPEVLREADGAFSMLFLTPSELIAIRDSRGFRPLAIGRLADAWVIASETCAFDLIDAQWVRDIEPGEMIRIDEDGLRSSHALPKTKHSLCLYEHVCFARPDSIVYGRSTNISRQRMGQRLAIEQPADADIVIPVPHSATTAAIGYATESGIALRFGLVRNDYVGRLFTELQEASRSLGLRIQLNPVRDLIVGRRVVLIDHSIVRGTTSKRIVRMIREAGAKEIHVRITSPPTISPCFYGVDIPDKSELIAAQLSVAEILRFIEADSLGYLSLEGLIAASGFDATGVCAACWNQDYPIGITPKLPAVREAPTLVTINRSHFESSEARTFESCFISYSKGDDEFAAQLRSRLLKENLQVWMAPENVQGGRKLYEQIESAIKLHDRLLVVLSEKSMKSEWVVTEIRKAREVEIEEGRRKLFPIRLVDFDTIKKWVCFDPDTGKDLAVEIREYFVPDFSNWTDENEFETSLQRLLIDLRAEEKK